MEQPIVSAVTHNESRGRLHADGHPRPAGRRRDRLRRGRRRARQRRHDHPERRPRRRRAVVLGAGRGRPRDAAAIEAPTAELGPMDVEENHDLGKVSLIGAGMRSHPGVAAKMFRTLADLGINLQMISTSPIKISCMIAPHRDPACRAGAPRGVRARPRADRRAEVERPPAWHGRHAGDGAELVAVDDRTSRRSSRRSSGSSSS